MNEQYNEGFSAFTDGDDFSDNPYPVSSKEHQEWADGWTAASCENDDGEDFFSDDEEESYAKYEDWINE